MNNSVEITSGDFLAGGGGVTVAMKNSGLKVKWVLNHDQIAIRTNMYNNKGVKHYLSNFYTQDEHEMEPVDFVWASIECTQHSRANAGKSKKIGSYTLGWELLRYVKHLLPMGIGIENVPEFKNWSPLRIKEDKKKSRKKYSALLIKDGEYVIEPDPERKGEEFRKWKKAICDLGYDYTENINNAADYGIPTRRVRYFAFFTKSSFNINFEWPQPTHAKNGENGLKKWVACKDFINLSNEGQSIFGRKFNEQITKGKRRPLSPNTLKRIAGGINKFAPDLAFIFQYYGSGLNVQSLEKPLNTITVKDRHVLVTMEKKQFLADYYGRDNTAHDLNGPANTIRTENSKHIISASVKAKFIQDHCHQDHYHTITAPMNPILTWQTKQFISCQYNSNGKPGSNNYSVEDPLPPVTTQLKHQFISHHFGKGSNQSLQDPANALTTKEKIQFITAYYSSSGNQKSQNQSVNNPLNSITTGTNKKALITAIENGWFDFDIKMRFLDPEELGRISTFPKKYFTDPLLKLNKKDQTRLIGNAVPPEWAQIMIKPVVSALKKALTQTPKSKVV